MTQEEKQLLLRDLCARLPYNHMVEYKGETYNVLGITFGRLVLCKPFMSFTLNEHPLVEEVKPYLFPMPNADEDEEYNKFLDELIEIELKVISGEFERNYSFEFEMNYYHKNHIDYRGLIPMGLAIDATGLNIY